jgi:hypothetical protein
MKRPIWLLGLAVTIGILISTCAELRVNGQATDTTLKGEVVDMHCFVTRHGGEGRGAAHAACANGCLARGVTAGFVASDGKVYLLFDEKLSPVKDRIGGLAGKQVSITGTVVERDGVRGIVLNTISPTE